VKWVIKTDKYEKIKFCCLQSRAAEPYLRLVGLDREHVLKRVLFVEGPGAYYHGSTGRFSGNLLKFAWSFFFKAFF
jgi:predicted DCC family thiol-disulfide oxidoreductase YuxK